MGIEILCPDFGTHFFDIVFLFYDIFSFSGKLKFQLWISSLFKNYTVHISSDNYCLGKSLKEIAVIINPHISHASVTVYPWLKRDLASVRRLDVHVVGGSGGCFEDPADIGTAHEKVGR